MKVLIVDTSLGLRGLGGAARVASSLFHELGKHGITTYYLGQRTDFMKNGSNAFFIEQRSFAEKQAGAHTRSTLQPIAESWLARLAYYSMHSFTKRSTEQIDHWISKIRPDIVVCNAVQDYMLLVSIRKHLGNAKLVYIDHANISAGSHGSLDYNNLGFTFGTGPYIGMEGAKKRLFSFFDGIVALNMEQYRNIKKYNSNVTIIYSSTLMDTTRPSKRQLALARNRARIRQNDSVVLYFGRLAEAQKNVSSLILAFKQVEAQKMKLVIVGNGGSAGMYADMARDDPRITVMAGRITDHALASYYLLADLYVLPSFWEGFNATFIEAAYFGDGLLLSTKGISEDVAKRFGSRLYTFDPSDPDELKGKIERYFSDASLRKRLRSLSRDIAQEYSKKRQIDGYANALKRFHQKGAFPKVISV